VVGEVGSDFKCTVQYNISVNDHGCMLAALVVTKENKHVMHNLFENLVHHMYEDARIEGKEKMMRDWDRVGRDFYK